MANVYAPNQDQAHFLSSILTRLSSFAGGCFVGGDLNIALSSSADTSSGNSSLPSSSLARTKSHLHS